MRPHYAYFAAYALRRFFDDTDGKYVRSAAERLNHAACVRATREMSADALSMLREVYTLRDTLSDNVYDVALRRRVPQDDLWTIIAQTEKRFAQERGLI